MDYIVKFKTSNITTLAVILSAASYISVEVNGGNVTAYNWTTGDRHVACALTADTWYWVKVNMNGSTKTVSYSTDGETWTVGVTITNDTNLSPSSTPLRFGVGVDSGDYGTSPAWITEQLFTGQIDLTGCKVEQGGSTIWTGVKITQGTPSDYSYYVDTDIFKGFKSYNKGEIVNGN